VSSIMQTCRFDQVSSTGRLTPGYLQNRILSDELVNRHTSPTFKVSKICEVLNPSVIPEPWHHGLEERLGKESCVNWKAVLNQLVRHTCCCAMVPDAPNWCVFYSVTSPSDWTQMTYLSDPYGLLIFVHNALQIALIVCNVCSRVINTTKSEI
jgi:hypothetical protein